MSGNMILTPETRLLLFDACGFKNMAGVFWRVGGINK
jgi:hypothetical protein